MHLENGLKGNVDVITVWVHTCGALAITRLTIISVNVHASGSRHRVRMRQCQRRGWFGERSAGWLRCPTTDGWSHTVRLSGQAI